MNGFYGVRARLGKFPANPANVAINCPIGHDIVVGVRRGYQLVSREHLAGIAQERPDHPKFRDGEHHWFSIPMGLEPVEVQFQAAMSSELFWDWASSRFGL